VSAIADERAIELLREIRDLLAVTIVGGAAGAQEVASAQDATQWYCNGCTRPLQGNELCGPCFDQRVGRFKK